MLSPRPLFKRRYVKYVLDLTVHVMVDVSNINVTFIRNQWHLLTSEYCWAL